MGPIGPGTGPISPISDSRSPPPRLTPPPMKRREVVMDELKERKVKDIKIFKDTSKKAVQSTVTITYSPISCWPK